MSPSVHLPETPADVASLVDAVAGDATASSAPLADVIAALDAWGRCLAMLPKAAGLPFLQLWWREAQLEKLLRAEFGEILGPLDPNNRAGERTWAPLGTILHWSAANVPIQPFLSLTAALLAGNRNVVRIPADTLAFARTVLAAAPSAAQGLLSRCVFLHFPHDRVDLSAELARRMDGAMIWGGQAAVDAVRRLPFPHWCRLNVFGPRVSVAAVDEASWRGGNAAKLAQRIAREVWQFDQQACSSPLTLWLEGHPDRAATDAFVGLLAQAFSAEERLFPRQQLPVTLSASIARGRAEWLLAGEGRRARFPSGPAWTLLWGGPPELVFPAPLHGKTLHIVEVADLRTATQTLDGTTQTLGLWTADPARELALARAAHERGVDRVVRLGLMHAFNSPWDGRELVRPLCRRVHYLPTT